MIKLSEVPNGDIDMYVIIGGEKNVEIVHVIRKTPKRIQVDWHFNNSNKTWYKTDCQYDIKDSFIWDVTTDFFEIMYAQIESFNEADYALDTRAEAELEVIRCKYRPHFADLKDLRHKSYVGLLRSCGVMIED